MKVTLLILLLAYTFVKCADKPATVSAETWKKIDSGLHIADFNSPLKSDWGDNKITILKIDPAFYDFSMISAKEKNESIKTVKNWAKSKKQLAIINAGMFLDDYKTNTGYMKNFNFINNSKLSDDNAIIAFNRKNDSVPEMQIIDRECQNWNELRNKYNSFSQGIRMIDCNRTNKWTQQNKKWSMVCIGTDREGNTLFIFTRSPHSVHDFINILLKLPIQLQRAQYLEGGPEASLYLNHNGTLIEKIGSYETGFMENDDNKAFWKIPNVIGISKKNK